MLGSICLCVRGRECLCVCNVTKFIHFNKLYTDTEDGSDILAISVDELTHYMDNGISIQRKKYKVVLHFLVCGEPPKLYVMKCKRYGPCYSCSICNIKDDSDKEVYFPTRDRVGNKFEERR